MTRPDGFAPQGAVRAAAYRLLWRLADLFRSLAGACLSLSAGLLEANDLRAVDLARWARFGRTVEACGDHERASGVDAGLEPWERETYTALLRPTDRVLLVGCGTGRDLLALCTLGYDVTGIEQVPEAADAARAHLARRGVDATVLTGAVADAPLDGRYDAVLFAEGCYASIRGTASRVAALARLRAHLAEREGRLLVTYLDAPPRSARSLAAIRIAARLSRAGWRPEQGDSFSSEFRGGGILRYEHRFEEGDVARECAAAGLQVVREALVGPQMRGLTAAARGDLHAPGRTGNVGGVARIERVARPAGADGTVS